MGASVFRCHSNQKDHYHGQHEERWRSAGDSWEIVCTERGGFMKGKKEEDAAGRKEIDNVEIDFFVIFQPAWDQCCDG